MEVLSLLGRGSSSTFLGPMLSGISIETFIVGIFAIAILVGIVYLIKWMVDVSSKNPIMSPENVAAIQGQRMEIIKADTQLTGDKSLYNDLIKNLATGERYLVNLCPLTASLGGYIGAGESGVFYSDFYLQNALRAGIRSFILPISTYADDNKIPPNWPYSSDPAIVARDVNGKIISLNGLSVKQFCTDVMRFNTANPTQSSEPILLFLMAETKYLPNKVKGEKDYAKLLSKLALELDVIPLTSRLTTLGGYGSAVGSQNEATILTQIPLTELQNKFIIFTDFDTKIGLKKAYSRFGPTLDMYTNFTMKPVIAQNAGLSVGSGARSIKLADISGSQVNWTDQARTVIHGTIDYNLTIPDVGLVEGAIKKGIQIVPIPFYTSPAIADIKPIWDLWKGYAWKLKEPDARYLKPDPVVPAKPSTAMNARVDQKLQPGQMGV